MLDVDLHGLAGLGELAPTARTGPIALEGYARHVVALEDFVDRRDRDIDLMVALQVEADSDGPILALIADAEDQPRDMWRRRERMLARATVLGLEAVEPTVRYRRSQK